MAETITASVMRGAKLLDEKSPGWHRRINLHALDLNDCQECILGQVYGEYANGLETLFAGDQKYFSRYHFGFSSTYTGGKDRGMRRLTAAWMRLIVKRILGRLGG